MAPNARRTQAEVAPLERSSNETGQPPRPNCSTGLKRDRKREGHARDRENSELTGSDEWCSLEHVGRNGGMGCGDAETGRPAGTPSERTKTQLDQANDI